MQTVQLSRTPASDKGNRSFEVVRLDNGFRALLVHDPEAVFAAACVSTQAGYFDDPPSLPGLAHFLEHAVHLGSEAFPAEGEYKAFLAQHGGSSNASTSMTHTQYHFKVHHQALQGALQRIGAALSAPLLTADSTAREVENVHAEYSRNCNSDSRRLLQLRRSLCRAPYSSFSTGNVSTLRDAPAEAGQDVAAALRTLWAQQYSAGAMCAAVVAPQELGVVAGWVADAFGGIRAGPLLEAAAGGITSRDSSSSNSSSSNGSSSGGCRWNLDVFGPDELGRLVQVAPMRDLRQLELLWYLPFGTMRYNRCKPWSWASHLLGHESAGSVAHLLKRQGLIQELSAGIAEEVRAGTGFMFWRVQIELTEAGLQHVDHVIATVYRGIQVLKAADDAARRATYAEAAKVSELRFDWRDRTEPLPLAQQAAHNLHYYPPAEVLSGPALLTEYDAAALDAFLDRLAPQHMVVLLANRQYKGNTDRRERWYGAEYSLGPLPQPLLQRIAAYTALPLSADSTTGLACHAAALVARSSGGSQQATPALRAGGGATAAAAQAQHLCSTSNPGVQGAPKASSCTPHIARQPPALEQQQQQGSFPPVPGELHLPEPNWALPSDLSLRSPPEGGPCTSDAASWQVPPRQVVDVPGLVGWYRHDTSFSIPKVHIKLHLVTPVVYESPASVVAARLLVRTLEDVLMAQAYHADLVATTYSLATDHTGLVLSVVGFSDVAPRLLALVLQGLRGLDDAAVRERFPTMTGRLRQSLANWSNSSPATHAEYAAEHALLAQQFHVEQLQQAMEHVQPEHVLGLARRLRGRLLHVDVLVYGNASEQEAHAVFRQVQDTLQPAGLQPCQWPRPRVLRLGPCIWPVETEGWLWQSMLAALQADCAVGGGAMAGMAVTWVPDNPNPANKDSAIYHVMQVGIDDAEASALLDLWVQASSKRCFHELRTVQRLGYSVNLHVHRLQHILSAAIRIQSPGHQPALLQERVAAWLAMVRGQLEGMQPDELDNHKRALHERYMEQPKSLGDACSRAWRPIRRRDAVFDRRQQKAEVIQHTSLQQLLGFHDMYMLPGAVRSAHLSAQICGGQVSTAAVTAAAAGENGMSSSNSSSSRGPKPWLAVPGAAVALKHAVTVTGAGQLAAFKAMQAAYPVTELHTPRPRPLHSSL